MNLLRRTSLRLEGTNMSMRSLFSACAGIVISCLLLSIPAAMSQTKPVVISTNPPDMATDVSPDLASYSITFSKPMDTRYGMASTNGWPTTSSSWSADQMTITITRLDLATPLQAGFTYMFYLNHPSAPIPAINFRDTEGNFLDYYTFSFTIAGGHAGLRKVAADAAKGFSWPYFLYVPYTIKDPATLFVQPNNTGTVNDDPAVHEQSARGLIESTRSWADQMGTPYLIPAFPRPATLPVGYTHALDRDALMATTAGYERIDLQLIAMIEDARAILSGLGIDVGPKVFLAGVSASGSFVSRFTLLHPDRVQAASIGAPGFGPIVPVSSWNGQDLPYPEGISDLNSLIGHSFDAAAFQAVPLQVYVGDEDDNVDPWWNPADPTVARIIAAFGGRHLYTRWPRYEAAYYSVTSLAQFVVFSQMGHSWAPWSYMQEFFENNRSAPQPPLPKPLQYKICLPHVVGYSPWKTEIALLNTVPGGVGVNGMLHAYKATGENPLESIALEIPPGGRREINVGTAYQHPEEIDYLVFHSDSGFLAGYTRFETAGNRVSLPATTGSTEGWFPKMEQDGWTGLAFVNIGNSQAQVKLTAHDENGLAVEEQTLPVQPGVKVVGLMDQLFHGDISRARCFSFSSDQKVVAFSVNGSGDGQMLDGLPALDRYLR